jgi:hypothetical protein
MMWLALAIVGLLAMALLLRGRKRPPVTSAADLRQAILSGAMFREPANNDDGSQCVLMDWSLERGSATLAAFTDGTTSLYYSSGGGMIGLGSNDSVRVAATAFRAEADSAKALFHPAETFPPPGQDSMRFYVANAHGTTASDVYSTRELQDPGHPLHRLTGAAQAVITAARSLQDRAAS